MTAAPLGEVFTKGALVDLAASIGGVTGALAGTSTFDKKVALRHLELLVLELEGCRGIFLGFKKSEYQEAQPEQDSGIKPIHAYPVASILAYKASEVFGIDPMTKQGLLRSYNEAINLLTPCSFEFMQANEQLPRGAGNRLDIYAPFYYRVDKLDIENDSTLDIGEFNVG